MADTQHTPTPWSIGGLSSNPGEGHVIESDSADRTIAWTANSYCTANDEEYISQEDIANAEFITLACNSYDALLEALESLVGWFGEVDYTDYDSGEIDESQLDWVGLHRVFDRAEAAIAKARGDN